MMKELPKCSECECPIFKRAIDDGLYEVACGCREEWLREDEEIPEEWKDDLE